MFFVDYIKANSRKTAYKVIGHGKVNLVIEMGLGAVIGEWYHIAEQLSKEYTVLIYERFRCDFNCKEGERTPKNIAKDLKDILELIDHEEKIIFIAHSQGGLYIQQFCRMYPKMIKAAIFIDPLSANDNKFKALLSVDEYKKSGVDKSKNFKLMIFICKIKLGFIIKKIMLNAPPFYYYNKFSKDEKEYILNALVEPSLYKTALCEYECAHNEENIKDLKMKKGFPNVPLVLITHSSEACVKEIMEFGKATRECAEKVENIWQNLMKEYLEYSEICRYVQAEKSSHFIHLTEPELINEALKWIAEEK